MYHYCKYYHVVYTIMYSYILSYTISLWPYATLIHQIKYYWSYYYPHNYPFNDFEVSLWKVDHPTIAVEFRCFFLLEFDEFDMAHRLKLIDLPNWMVAQLGAFLMAQHPIFFAPVTDWFNLVVCWLIPNEWIIKSIKLQQYQAISLYMSEEWYPIPRWCDDALFWESFLHY